MKSDEICVFVLGLTNRTDNTMTKGLKLMRCYSVKVEQLIYLLFIYYSDNYSNMLNTGGLHLCDRGITRLVNNFRYVLNK